MGDVMTGYWSVRSVDRLRPEHMEEVRAALEDAGRSGELVVTVEGITFVWHEMSVVTEDAVRSEARRAALSEAAEAVRGLREAAAALNVPTDWASDNRETVIVKASDLDRLLDEVDALLDRLAGTAP